MAKKKTEEDHFDALDAMVEEQKKFYNKAKLDVFSLADPEAQLVGVKLPAFSLMYLFDGNVLPLSKIIGIAGAAQSYKSGLGFEMHRWIQQAGGTGLMIETEGKKYSPSLIKAVMGEENANKRFLISSAANAEEAQEGLSKHCAFYRKEGNEKYMKTITSLAVDSMTGVDTEGASDKIMQEKGHAEQDFSRMALLWTKFLRPFSAELVGLPTVCILINHLKTKIDANPRPGAPPGKTTPGGDAQRFHSSIYLYTFKAGSSQRKTYIVNGERVPRLQEIRSIKIRNDKSSLGTDGRDIVVDLIWYYNENNEQVAYFDWESATVELLMQEQNMINCMDTKRKLLDLIDIRVDKSSNATAFSSEILGMKQVEAHEMGLAIHQNAQLMEELQKFFHIKQHNLWQGTMPPAPKKVKEPTPDELGV